MINKFSNCIDEHCCINNVFCLSVYIYYCISLTISLALYVSVCVIKVVANYVFNFNA